MELELRSVERQGAHEAGGAPRGGKHAPTLMDRVWPPGLDSFASIFYKFQKYSPWSFRSFRELLFLHKNNTMAILLKTTSIRVSSIQIMQVRVQNKGKSVWKSRHDGDVSIGSSWSSNMTSRTGLPYHSGADLTLVDLRGSVVIRLLRIYFSKHFCPCFGL